MSQVVTKNSEKQENSGKEHNVETEELIADNMSTNEASTAAASLSSAVGGAAPKISKAAADAETSPKVENKKTPMKRTPTKRMSFIERAQKESEELVKNLGGSLELEGGRRTRSSTRGTPTRSAAVATPPPVKKARASPAVSGTPTTPRRGRGRKIDVSKEPITDNQLPPDENKIIKEATEEETTNIKKTIDKDDLQNTCIEKAGDESVKDIPNETVSSELSEKVQESASVTEEGDKTDTALELIPEESQNNVDHCSKKPEGSSSNMSVETGDVSKSKGIPEVVVTPAEEEQESGKEQSGLLKQKEPTPEPMDVDSTRCSDTTESVPNTAENVERVAEKDRNSIETSVTDGATVQNSSDAQTSEETPVVPNPEVLKDVNPATTTMAETVEEDKMVESATTDDAQGPKEAIELDIAASGEPQATTKAATTMITENSAKSENDLCEPKIASPPTTDGAVAATPQYCN